PFFQATSTKVPLTQEVSNVNGIKQMPSAGPYAFSRNDVNTLTSIRQNPFWKKGPGRNRPRNLKGLDLQWNLNEQTAFNQVKAKKLAKGHFKSGKITVGYRSSGTINPAQAQIVRRDLILLGFKSGDIEMKPYSGANIYDAMGIKGNPLDMGVSMGWCSDYPDPYDWINILLYGPSIQAENNVNYSYMNLASWNKKMASAARLVGPKRLRTYGQPDLVIMN